VDGEDVLAVYNTAREAVERARAERPDLIECKTYRFRAHSEGMREAGYRSSEEIDAWKKRDPVLSWKNACWPRNGWTRPNWRRLKTRSPPWSMRRGLCEGGPDA